MRIRSIFLMGLFLAGFLATFSIIPTPAQAECNFTSGAFNNCSDSFSSPAILPNAVSITNNSNMEILSAILNNNVAIDVASNSKLTFGVSSGNGSLIFNLNDANSSINYRGGASGSVDVNLNAVCGGSDCFRTSGNIRNLNFQSGSQFTVGAVEYRGDEESANVTINNVVGNGSIRLTNGSVLTITNYAYDDSNPANAIQSISGGNEFYSNASKIFINELDVPHPIFNGYVNVLNIIKAEDVVFNTAADIGVINNSKNIRFNSSGAKINAGTIENSGVLTIYNSLVSIDNISNTDEIDVKYSTANITNLDQVHIVKVQDGPSGGSIVGSTVKIDNLGYLEEADIDSNSTLNIAGGSNAHLDAVYGDGTLHVEDGSIHIHNINLNNLVFDGGDITLEKDFQDAPHVINNITRTDSSFAGGNLTQTQGTLIIRNIDWLNSLTIQGGDLALSSVNHIGSLNMNSGNLYLVVGHDNNVAYDNNSVIHVDNATFGGGVTTTMVRSTAELKLNVPNQFLLIDSDNGFLATRAVNQDLFYVTLDPARWDVSVIPNPNNPNQLLLRVERICTLYEEIAGECGGVDVIDPPEPPRPPVKDLAKYLDRLIAQGIPLDILDKLEVYSTTPRELYNNLSSLIPLSGETYLKSAHYGLSTALSVSKSNALSEDKDLWAMYYYSNGRYKDDN
ncbi:MAG: hypothetical protein LBQ34_01035, partial [Alphaproteobacteria bacterium]|nr:hypothetical protein [Alphaproteobacteria bacterium]